MPQSKAPPSLFTQSQGTLAKMVQSSLVRLDSVWSSSAMKQKTKRNKSPKNSPKSSPISFRTAGVILPPSSEGSPPLPAANAPMQIADQIDLMRWAKDSGFSTRSLQNIPIDYDDSVNYPGKICDQQEILQQWLLTLPTTLLEDVVEKVLDLIEYAVNDDKDRKLILTLINIENSKPSDFSFGIYSLLLCLANTSITRIPFSTKLWFSIWEYEQLTTSNYLKHCLRESIPNLSNLVSMNLSYIATDQAVYLLSKHCPSLEDLCLDHSSVSDRCARFFCGYEKTSASQVENGCWLTQIYPKPFPGVHQHSSHSSLLHYRQNSTSSSTFSLLPSTSNGSSSLLSPPDWCNQIPVMSSSSSSQATPTFVTVTGCPLLKRMSLQGCSSVTDKAIWCLLLHKPGLQVLRYHQAYSVAEILCRECSIFKKYPFTTCDETESEDDSEIEDDYCPLQKRQKHLETEESQYTGISNRPANSGSMENDKRYDKTEDECEGMEIKDLTRPKKKKGKKRALMPKVPQLELRVFDHSFPYGLSLPSDVIKQVSTICPRITTLNLVANDEFMPDYAQMSQLTKVSVELEDCFGVGIYQFLKKIGHQLTELSLSCSSDADSSFVEGGGQTFQLFNVGLRMAEKCCPNLTHLNISGCGLVSNQLIEQLDNEDKDPVSELGNLRVADPGVVAKSNPKTASLRNLKSLILLTYYDDDVHIQTCDEKLLLTTLQGVKNIECISLEGNFSVFLTDSFICSILQENTFENLKIFDVRGRTAVPLTKTTAEKFMALPKIKELRMSSWNISNEEFKDLEDIVKCNGWDLHLTKRSFSTSNQ